MRTPIIRIQIWSQIHLIRIFDFAMHALDNHNQDDHDPELSNDYSSTSYFPEFVHRQDTKKPSSTQNIIPFAAKIQHLQHQLITGLQIITPTRLRSFQLRKQLKNYHFQKIEKRNQSQNLTMFGMKEEEILREQNMLILTLTSIIKDFRSGKDKKFFIVTKKGDRVFSFYHEEKQTGIESVLKIAGFSDIITPELQKQNIPFQKVPHHDYQKILIKNQAISIFWGRMVNKILQNQKNYRSFHILANFPIINGYEALPIQSFNGSEIKKDFHPFASEKTNILGQPLYELFRIKMEGFLTVENLKDLDVHLTQTFGGSKFEVNLKFHQCAKEENV